MTYTINTYAIKNRCTNININLSNFLKCIACIVIAIHHYSQDWIELGLSTNPIYSVFRSVGGDLSVTIFFFLSGYGLMASEKKRHLTILQFLKKRLVRILVPFWIVNLVFVSTYWICGLNNYSTTSFIHAIESILFFTNFDGTSWFVEVLLIFYLAFTCFAQFKSSTLSLLTIFTTLFIIISILLGQQSYFWSSLFAFPFGAITYCHSKRILDLCYKILTPILSLLIYLFILYIAIFKMECSGAIWHQMNNILLVILLLSLISHLPQNCFNWFKLPKWADAYYEMYLVHPKLLFMLFGGYAIYTPLWLFLIISIVGAIILHNISDSVVKLIQK